MPNPGEPQERINLTPIKNRQRRRREKLVQVDDLLPPNRVELTVEEIQFYQSLGRFAFAIDRQSDHRVLKDTAKTGQEVRVTDILRAAEWLRVRLPVPPENPNWLAGGDPLPGELQYLWTVSEVAATWFVDGTGKRASGYIINEATRPRLWRGYHTALELHRLGCPPVALIIGEPTRFFRDTSWLSIFAKALWSRGIKLYVCPFGEITDLNLGSYVMFVNALSGRIQEHCQQARQAYERRGKIFNRNRNALGVIVEDEAETAVADPATWPALADMIRRLASGELPTMKAAVVWLKETYGIRRSEGWLRFLIHDRGGLLDGYYRLYRYNYDVCKREDRSQTLSDINVTPNGNRRYLVDIGPGTPFPIEHRHGTEPIPAAIVEQARTQVGRRRGRARREGSRWEQRRALSILPTHLLRCAHCRAPVTEFSGSPDRPGKPGKKSEGWRCVCQCVDRFAQRHCCSTTEARRVIQAQTPHPLILRGGVSDPLWELLRAELVEHPVPPRNEAPDIAQQRQRLEQELAEARTGLETVITNFLFMRNPSEDIIAACEAARLRQEARVKELQAQVNMVCADTLEAAARYETFREWRAALQHYLTDREVPITERREIVLAMVEEILVNLETGAFTFTIRPPVGKACQGSANQKRCSGTPNRIILFGRACAQALPLAA